MSEELQPPAASQSVSGTTVMQRIDPFCGVITVSVPHTRIDVPAVTTKPRSLQMAVISSSVSHFCSAAHVRKSHFLIVQSPPALRNEYSSQSWMLVIAAL